MAEFVALLDTIIPPHRSENNWRGVEVYLSLQCCNLSGKFAVFCEASGAEHLQFISTMSSFSLL